MKELGVMGVGPSRPKIRNVEAITVAHRTFGKALMLRDGEGISTSDVVLNPEEAVAVTLMNGERDLTDIAAIVSSRCKNKLTTRALEDLVTALDEHHFLASPRFFSRRSEVHEAFRAATVRAPMHAGGAYHGEATALEAFIEVECFQKRGAQRTGDRSSRTMVALCAPHMDLWRAAAGYGSAYGTLAQDLPIEARIFVVLGTCHAGMRSEFAVCNKTFATPLGDLRADENVIHRLEAGARFDVHADAYMHKAEHSLEFQVVFLRHLLNLREMRGGPSASDARIVPILCGLGQSQVLKRDPRQDANAESFLEALTGVLAERATEMFVVAGADLAHIGPRFGDPQPLGEEGRAALADRDRGTLEHLQVPCAEAFFEHATEDLNSRRICGVGPLYTLLRGLSTHARGEVLNYEQHVDAEEGSIVSHASVGFYQ